MAMILFSLFLIAKTTSYRNLERLRYPSQAASACAITVDVSGSVRKPGKMQVPSGVTIGMVLRKARVQPLADLSNIDLDQMLHSSCSLYIPALEKILVEVRGCVEENVFVELPAFSRVCDLKKHLKISKDADAAFLRRRKILKNHEIIHIPSKKQKDGLSD